jgi:hypothetical protein
MIGLMTVALLLMLDGCAELTSTTTELRNAGATNEVKVTTRVHVSTLFDSQSQLTKFENRGSVTQSNQWASGTRMGQLTQESATTTNFNALVGEIVGAAVSAAKKP